MFVLIVCEILELLINIIIVNIGHIGFRINSFRNVKSS